MHTRKRVDEVLLKLPSCCFISGLGTYRVIWQIVTFAGLSNTRYLPGFDKLDTDVYKQPNLEDFFPCFTRQIC